MMEPYAIVVEAAAVAVVLVCSCDRGRGCFCDDTSLTTLSPLFVFSIAPFRSKHKKQREYLMP